MRFIFHDFFSSTHTIDLSGFFLPSGSFSSGGIVNTMVSGIQAEQSKTFRCPSQKGKLSELILEEGFYSMFPRIPDYLRNHKQEFFQGNPIQVSR